MSVASKYKDCIEQRKFVSTISLDNEYLTDDDVIEFVDCLLEHPNAVSTLWMSFNQFTDEIGIKLAKYISITSTLHSIGMGNNNYTLKTFTAIAAALRVNVSLHTLYLHKNPASDLNHINSIFVDALRLNPCINVDMIWLLRERRVSDNNFKALKNAAEKSTSPSMLEFLLCVHLDTEKIKTKAH